MTRRPTLIIFAIFLFAFSTVSATALADVPEYQDEEEEEEAPNWGDSESQGEIETSRETTSSQRTQSTYEPPPPRVQDSNFFTLTFSPIHLIFPLLELNGEFQLAENFGAAAIVGYGRVSEDSSLSDDTLTASVSLYELGAQGNYYPFRPFDGFQVGGQIMAANSRYDDGDVAATATAVNFAGYIGYKAVAKIGFTFLGQLGYGYTVMAAEAEGFGDSVSQNSSGGGFHLKLNLGWSF